MSLKRSAQVMSHRDGIDIGMQVAGLMRRLHDIDLRDIDRVLGRFGLQRRRSGLRPLFWFVSGAAIAAGAALMLAPMKGEELTRKIEGVVRRTAAHRRSSSNSASMDESRGAQSVRSDAV